MKCITSYTLHIICMEGLYSILSSPMYICYLHAMCKGIMTMIDVATWLMRASSSYLKLYTCMGSNSSCLQCDIMNWPEESEATNRRLNNRLFFVIYSWVNLQHNMHLRSDMYMLSQESNMSLNWNWIDWWLHSMFDTIVYEHCVN